MKSVCSMILCFVLILSILVGCATKEITDATEVEINVEGRAELLPESTYSALKNDKIAWGLKKNKAQPPEVPSSITNILDEFDGTYISNKKSTLFLTFDEGYENGYSSQILDTLKQMNVPAAFFVTGDYIKTEGELVKRMVEEGHIVGNHTKNHPSMPSVSNISTLAKEITELDDEFFVLTGKRMQYFRPPRGEFSERTLAVTKDLGYKTVLWSFAYADWERDKIKGAQYAYDSVMPYLHDGAIILLHAVSKDNADALSRIITDARAKGYEFKSLDDL